MKLNVGLLALILLAFAASLLAGRVWLAPSGAAVAARLPGGAYHL